MHKNKRKKEMSVKKKWLGVLLSATMITGSVVPTNAVFAMDDFSDTALETEETAENNETEEDADQEDYVDIDGTDQNEQTEDVTSVDTGIESEEEDFSGDSAGTTEESLFDDGSESSDVAFQSAAEGEVELPEYIFGETWNKQYDVLYHEKDKTYLYKGQAVVFKDENTIQVGDKEYSIKNKETEVTTTVGDDGKVTVKLSNLSTPVNYISGQWNSSYAGKINTVYKTDISGLEEAKGDMYRGDGSLDLGVLAAGVYHLTGGVIYEQANEWSPGYDFGDGKGSVTGRNFGYLPDLTVKVGDSEEEEDAYLGVNAGSEVPDSFTNDLWTQYDFKELKVGGTAKLVPRRVEEAITDAIGNNVELPHFNYEIIKGDSVTLDESNNSKVTVTAVKEGNTVVKITYDALDHSGGTHFDAVDPVNTAYVVYSVDGNENISITDNIVYKDADKKDESDVVFRSYDTYYFTEGDSTPFTLKASAENAESIVVKCNGITVPQNGTEGTYTLPLENRSNIIEITAKAADGTTRSKFHVLDARKIKINVENKSHEGEELEAGDTAIISFTGITMPVYKLATIYNPCFDSPWGGEATNVHYTYGSTVYKGKCRQWDLAIKNSFEVTFPEEGIFTFKDGGIYCDWWGSVLGSDKTTDNPGEPNLNAPVCEGEFSFMPDFDVTVAKNTRINVDSVTLNKTELQLEEQDQEQLTATITPEEVADKKITWKSSNEQVATVSADGKVTAVAAGEAEITAEVEGKTATCKVTVTAIPEVNITAAVTPEKIYDGDKVTVTLTGVTRPKEVSKEKNIWEEYTGYTTDIPDVGNVQGNMETITFTVPEGTASGTYTLNNGYYFANFGGVRAQGYFIVGNTEKKFYEDRMPEIKVNVVNREEEKEQEELRQLREKYSSEADAAVDYNNYREAEQEVLKDLVDTAKEKISNLEKEEDMQAVINKLQKQVAAVKTADQYADAELKTVKAEARKDLDAYKNSEDYREEQQKELANILTKAKLNISDAESAEEVDKIVEETKAELDKLPTDKELTEKEEAETAKTVPVVTLKVATGKTNATLTWNKVAGADGYKIYGTRCNGKAAKLIKTVKAGTLTWKQSKLKKATHYKYQVVAYKNVNGKQVTIVKSDVMHAVTTGGKYGNAKKVTVNKEQVSIVAGKSFTLKVKVTNTTKNVKYHVSAVRYKSSNSGVATVSKNGVIKGIKKGACTVYCYAPNGVYKAVKVTVK